MTHDRSVTPSSRPRRATRASPPTRSARSRARSIASQPLKAKKAGSRAAGVTRGAHVASSAGGRGYLPRPWTGVASSQCRPCEPRPVEGDVGDRALPHGGARRPCRALRERAAHTIIAYNSCRNRHCPKCQGAAAQRMAGRARGRAAAGAVLSCRVHAAGADRRHRLPEQGRDLRSAVQGLGRDAAHDRGRPQASRRPHRHHCPSCIPGARRSPTIRTCT